MRAKQSRLIPSFGSTKRHLSVIMRVLQYSAVLPVVENTQYRTNAVGTNPDLFCIHAEVPANKREGRDPSCSRGIAIKLTVSPRVRVHVPNGPKHMANPNQRTNAVGTNPDLFYIHAEVPANKKEGRDPSRS
jgi:hypothetical protein